MTRYLLAAFLFCIAATSFAAREFDTVPATYTEKYRPRYHYTPAHRWIGDPCGLILHDGKFRSYCWGGAVSDDLIHWQEETQHAIKNVPEGISCFTGSVVVDKLNTAGHGENCLVACYTSFDGDSKKQSQSIAFSHDGGKTFQDYDLNPVLDIWSTEFRDPTVIWDAPRNQWVMFVAKALQKKIGIYTSPNLKDWTWASDFGPLGDSEKSWECPDIFQIDVDGEPGVKKWVMVVSVNWAREQYFVGEFDGKEFVADNPNQYPLYLDEGLDYYASRVFQTPDNPDAPVYTIGWVNTWDYAPTAPSTWGKGIWSIPREYKLKNTNDGFRLYQLPVAQFDTLKGKEYAVTKKLSTGVTPLPAVSKMGNTYELDVEFSHLGTHPFGLYLCEGEGRRLTLQYDPSSQYFSIDRTNVTDADIPKFERKAHVKIPAVCEASAGSGEDGGNTRNNPCTSGVSNDGKLKLCILVDKSTVEIFANDGATTMSLLTFAADGQDGVSLFSLAPGVIASIKAYPIAPIH